MPEYREIVRWSAGLTIHVEEARIRPCVGTETAHADRDVSFKHHAVTVGIVSGLTQLTVEVILGIAYQVYGVAVGAENLFQYLVAVFCKVAPLFEIRSAEFVAKHTECGIRQQPRCVAVYKCLVFFRFESFVCPLEHIFRAGILP